MQYKEEKVTKTIYLSRSLVEIIRQSALVNHRSEAGEMAYALERYYEQKQTEQISNERSQEQ